MTIRLTLCERDATDRQTDRHIELGPYRHMSTHTHARANWSRFRTLVMPVIQSPSINQSIKDDNYYYYYNHFMALWIMSGTTRVSRYQKVHFANFCIFWCKMKITQADAPTIRMDCHLIQTNGAPISAIPTILCRITFLLQPSRFILAWDRHQICWLAYLVAWLIKDDKLNKLNKFYCK